LIVNIKLENLGKYPVKVIEDKGGAIFKVNSPNFKDTYNLNNDYNSIINSYVINGSPLNPSMNINIIITSDHIKGVATGKYSMFLLGSIRYKNLVTSKIKRYNYQIRYRWNPKNVEYMINENITP